MTNDITSGKEIRFKVTEEMFNRVKGLAHEDNRTIAGFIRMLLSNIIACHDQRLNDALIKHYSTARD